MSCIKDGGNMFTDFSYNQLFRWKRRMIDAFICKNCRKHLLVVAAYLKCHVADYPHTKPLCVKIMKDHLTLKGQEEYASYNLRRALIYDRKVSNRDLGEMINDDIFICETAECKKPDGEKMKTRELPSPKCFPSFNLEKESKMWLTQLDPPPQECIDSLKEKIRKVVHKYGPRSMDLPGDEAVKSIGPSLYSDGHEPKPDYMKPEHTWRYSWTYQSFKTDAQTQREVWLPPKSYKLCSSWWHFFTEPICKRIPWLVCNDTVKEVRLNLHKRFKPCRSMDLKGFGLQFPKEYAIACMEVITEIYPDDKAEEYINTAKSLFGIMSVKVGDEFIKPRRGVGLGYFSNIMSLVVASLLEDCQVVQMFNDDMLIPDETYKKARQILTDHKFIINEKKSGHMWYKVPMFANVSMAPRGTLMYFEVQGTKAAVFNKKYHYQRKASHIAAPWVYRWKQTFHYERIFGYEVRPGESQEHPCMLGLNPQAEYPVGYVKGGMLRKYISPSEDDEEYRRIWAISFPWKDKKDRNFQQTRQEAIEKYKDRVHYTEYDEYLNPRIKAVDSDKRIVPDFFLGSYQLPRWADLKSILFESATCGRTTMGIYPKRAAYYMLDHLLSDNPIHSWITGGYEIISPFYRIPGVSMSTQMLYNQLKVSTRFEFSSVNKTKGEESISILKEGSGLDFLQGINLVENEAVEFKLDNYEIDDDLYGSESESVGDCLEDDLDCDLPDEDGNSSAGDYDAEDLW